MNKNKTYRIVLFAIGLFLAADGLLSIYFGNSCLNNCANNNYFGNLVRIIRTFIGFYIIYLGTKK
jgi:hypothetical protein